MGYKQAMCMVLENTGLEFSIYFTKYVWFVTKEDMFQ